MTGRPWRVYARLTSMDSRQTFAARQNKALRLGVRQVCQISMQAAWHGRIAGVVNRKRMNERTRGFFTRRSRGAKIGSRHLSEDAGGKREGTWKRKGEDEQVVLGHVWKRSKLTFLLGFLWGLSWAVTQHIHPILIVLSTPSPRSDGSPLFLTSRFPEPTPKPTALVGSSGTFFQPALFGGCARLLFDLAYRPLLRGGIRQQDLGRSYGWYLCPFQVVLFQCSSTCIHGWDVRLFVMDGCLRLQYPGCLREPLHTTSTAGHPHKVSSTF